MFNEICSMYQLRSSPVKGEPGTKVEMDCPKCGKFVSIVIDNEDLRISSKPLHPEEKQSKDSAAV